MNVRMLIKTQTFLSHGSFLGNKVFEHFAGFNQIAFREVCQNSFLSAFIGSEAKTPCFWVNGTLLRYTFWNIFHN